MHPSVHDADLYVDITDMPTMHHLYMPTIHLIYIYCSIYTYTAAHCNAHRHIHSRESPRRTRHSHSGVHDIHTVDCTRLIIKLMTLACDTRPDTLQHTATHCNTLQHTATHRNTPQHTHTHTRASLRRR